jgi:transcription antitermination factor NusG
MKAWYVIQTKPKKEHVVVGQLRLAGYEIFFPVLRNCLTTKALFPSYVFVCFEKGSPSDYRKMQYTRGVNRILGTRDDGPVAVPEDVVAFLIKRADSRGIIQQELFTKVGELVRVQRGLLKDLVGILQKPVDTVGRLHVLFKMFNQSVRAVMTVRDVVPIATS